ncbi:hypothetical protein EDB92DRAFT_2078658 [Lactarius akahatsu]|uniref:ARM repeat-containing protein n=1 Tax=Lactarius akahatsu TaxID=416441 RepID=A0AAD4QHW0_9AGAM|nr:hypothetical protein EDB92DRAFT_2078658 [Lactarius akahatsu]
MADPSIIALATELAGQTRQSDADWNRLEATAQALANSLRVKNSDTQTALGTTQLPAVLAAIIKDALRCLRVPDASHLPALYETLRVGANICVDHDENREHLLESGFLTALVSLLGRYTDLIPSDKPTDFLPLSVAHLRVVRTAIGVLLNASLGYEPVKAVLNTSEAPATILRLAVAIYPSGAWARSPQPRIPPGEFEESWQLRSGLSSWAWRATGELKDNAPATFGPDILPQLVAPIRSFVPPFQTPVPAFDEATPLRRTLVSADFEAFEESCSLLEALTLDDEDVRLSLARGLTFPDEHGGVRCLAEILEFIDRGDYHPLWKDLPSDNAQRERSFDFCKAALIKAVVEIAGEEKNVDVLWDDSDQEHPGGALVAQMVRWIKKHKDLKENNRDDLLVCATLTLGNLLRHGARSLTLTSPPISLAPDIAALLRPETDIKVKHGLIGLLKHLAYAAPARAPLSEAGIVERLVDSNIFQPSADIAEMVQVNAIGVVKHLCSSDAKNCYGLTLPAAGRDAQSTGLHQILTLVERSDTTAVKSEGTRVVVNVIRTLWHEDTPDDEQRRAAMSVVGAPPVTLALAQLVGRSKKYPILINEGIVALTLLSLSSPNVVLDAITTPLPQDAPGGSAPASAAESEIGSPMAAPGRAVDTLAYLLKGRGANVPEEVRANACVLLGQVCREGGVGAERVPEVVKLKAELRPLLDSAAETDKESRLKTAAAGALRRWG